MNKRIFIITVCTLSTIYFFSYMYLLYTYDLPLLKGDGAYVYDIVNLTTVTATVDDVSTDIVLPYEFTDLDDRTTVEISAHFEVPEGGYFYISTEYTPTMIYANDTLIYEYGQDGTFPDFLEDPPLFSSLVSLDLNSGDMVSLRIEYLSPTLTDSFNLEPIMFGSQSSLYVNLFHTFGFSIIFSTILILASILLGFLSVFIITFEEKGIFLLWLAIAGLTAGFWLSFDCPLTSLFINSPSRLYIGSVFSMVIFPAPLIYFTLSTVDFHNKIPLYITAIIELFLAILTLFSQLFHAVSLMQIEHVFTFFIPTCISTLTLMLLYEYIVHRNQMAQTFIIPSIMFTAFTILEFVDYQLKFSNMTISFLQIGIMIFILSGAIIAGFFIKDTLTIKEHNKDMEFHLKMLDYQSQALEKQNKLMMDTSDTVKKQRHDLRHQLTVIQNLATQKDTSQLQEYLNTIINNIPSEQIFYCQNIAINAILSHYSTICEQRDITLTIDVTIPTHSNTSLNSDYCVIFANLLENAVEACQFMETGDKFITISSRMRYNTLLISMENSFDGHYQVIHGKARSRKRDEYGIGLSSINSVATKHGGDSTFKANGNIFYSSVYMVL
ncbi:MAG: GHKL domain-containing protein [Lachnospiraceae bacterium]